MFCDRLKKFRESLNISARQFAFENDIDARTYNNYEAGMRIPNVTFLEALGFKYNISLDWLILGQGTMFKRKSNTLELTPNFNVEKYFAKCGHRIIELQEKNDLSNQKMSKIMQISETNYLKICAGKEQPSLDSLNELKANFDVDIDWLMYGNQYPQENTTEAIAELSLTKEELRKLKNLLNNI